MIFFVFCNALKTLYIKTATHDVNLSMIEDFDIFDTNDHQLERVCHT